MDKSPQSDYAFVSRKEKIIEELRVLAEINKAIHSTMNIDRLLQILVEKAVVGVNFERCLIYLLEGDYLRCAAWIDRINTKQASIIKKLVGFRMDETSVELLSVKQRKIIYVKDARTDRRVSPKFLEISDTKEYCAIPLIGRKNVLGVITGDKFYSGEPISTEEIATLNLFSSHISLAIENAKLYQEKEEFNQLLEKTVLEKTFELRQSNYLLSKKMNQLSTLHQMSKLLNESLKKDDVFKKIGVMLQSLGHEICSIQLYNAGRYSVVMTAGLDDAYSELPDNPIVKTIFEEAMAAENPFSINDLDSPDVINSWRQYCKTKKIRSCLLVPVMTKGTLIALIKIFSQDSGFFKGDLNSFFHLFGQQAAVALENAKIFEKMIDEKKQITTISKKIEQENIYLKARAKTDFVIGKSSSMLNVMNQVNNVACTPTTVLIHGETGTGKELIARAIHEVSPRKNEALICMNCAAIPEGLIEDELFGHERGVFTGAHQRRIGMFELAQGGTIFLDEIGEMSLATQTKLLRVLQEKEIRRLGAKTSISLDVKVITATNRDLHERVEKGLFRSDLFYRINVFPIVLPPLRERKEDIPDLTAFFLKKHGRIARDSVTIDQEIMRIFRNYSWPGNIRELENVIERLIILSRNSPVTKDDLPKEILSEPYNELPEKKLGEAMSSYQEEMIIQALRKSGGKKSQAAKMLGLHNSNFSRLLKKYNIQTFPALSESHFQRDI